MPNQTLLPHSHPPLMADASSPFSQPHHHQSKSNFPMLYYGLVVVGTAALVLLTYNLIIIRWCTNRHGRSPARPGRDFSELPSSRSSEHMNRNLLSSFKYKKEVAEVQKEEGDEYECAVCLSVFEEGEEVRKLPRCTHTFHALCIDMWLYSHSDCPLCRAPVAPLHCYRHIVSSGQSLQGSAVPV